MSAPDDDPTHEAPGSAKGFGQRVVVVFVVQLVTLAALYWFGRHFS